MDDKLKKFEDIFTVNPRCDYAIGGQEDFYSTLRQCELSESVPSGIRENFSTALNTMLYSWYAYPMSTPALLYAITTLELALKESLNPQKKNKSGLGFLLNRAMEEGIITDEIFGQSGKCQRFVTYIPELRNSFAHGSHFLMGQWNLIDFFEDIAAVIEHLFKRNSHKN
jgi:hypothetical protein